jgi:2-methylisocitrate lyase-like PEP mutase family enzyme
MDQKSKAELLRRLHHGPEILVFLNAWDAGADCVLAPGVRAYGTFGALL